MRSKRNRNSYIISKKKYNGGNRCNKYPNIWSFNDKCFEKCPANTCSRHQNDELMCRPLQKSSDKCIIAKITNNKITGDADLYKGDGYLFENHLVNSYTHKPQIKTCVYYGKIVEKTDENNKLIINKEGLGLLIETDTDYIYYGNFKDDHKNGYGKMIWSDKNYYEGEWKDDEMHGKGKYTSVNGSIYNGEMAYGVKNGKGKYTSANGDTYDGEWKDGLKHGYGVSLFNTKDEYRGEYKENDRHGRGIYKWNNGNVYDGEWQNNNRNGRGKFTFKNGIYIEGNWEDSNLNGFVNTYYANFILSGMFVNGMKQGEFTYTQQNGKIKKYFFIDDKLYNFEKNVDKYYISNPVGIDENKHITIIIHLHGSDIINSVCNLNISKHVRVMSPVLCGLTNLMDSIQPPIDSFNIAYNITHLRVNDFASSHQKMMKIIEIFNEHIDDFYDLKQGSYSRPIIDHRYSINYSNFFQIYLIDTNFNSPELFQKGEFEVITEKMVNLKEITDITQFEILHKIIDHLLIEEINGFETFLRSDLINVLLDLGYDTINMIDFSCRGIDEAIIQRDYNETTGKNYQCEYRMNDDESSYLGDEVSSFHI